MAKTDIAGSIYMTTENGKFVTRGQLITQLALTESILAKGERYTVKDDDFVIM